MKLIVGLGNPGGRYERTRHNAGFMVVDAFARKFRIEIDRHERDAYVGKGQIAGRTVMVAKPQTFMNLSGSAVSKLVSAHLESLDDLVVVYDDIDLPVGRLRIRQGGSAGTHNGMKSIVASLASEKFARVRVGVKGEDYATARDLADYVLDDFPPEDEPKVEGAIARAVDALAVITRGDLARAMNQFNKDPVEEEPKP
ncbi:MAG: aminoacyl-tRNA hydrolase [Thermoanaerobaculia bacterium]|nr:aminoacyl-tRNA hydrolase [Thermoanaerobaculia bacterium]